MKRMRWASVVALFLALSAFAFGLFSLPSRTQVGTRPAVDGRSIDNHAGHADAPSDSASTRSYREASVRMSQSLDIDYTGDADEDFLRGLIARHEGAAAMARIALEYGDDPEVRGFAEETIRNQEAQILRIRLLLVRRERGAAPAARS